MMHERLFAHMSKHPGVKFVTFDDIANDFAKRSPRKKAAPRKKAKARKK